MRFSGSKAISDGFAILSSRFAAMAGITAAFYILPTVVFLWLAFTRIMTVLVPLMAPDKPQGDIGELISFFSELILPLIGLWIVYGLIRLLGSCALTAAAAGREDEGTGDAISAGARALLPALGVYLLLWLAWMAIFVLLFGSAFVSILNAAKTGTPPELGSVGTFLLLIPVLLVVGIYVFAKLSLVLPVIVIERVGNPFTAIARSWRLTRGASLKIIVIFILIGIVQIVINGVISGLSGGGLFPVAREGADPMAMFSGINFWVSGLLPLLVSVIASMYTLALLVGIHRQVAGPQGEDVTDTFS